MPCRGSKRIVLGHKKKKKEKRDSADVTLANQCRKQKPETRKQKAESRKQKGNLATSDTGTHGVTPVPTE